MRERQNLYPGSNGSRVFFLFFIQRIDNWNNDFLNFCCCCCYQELISVHLFSHINQSINDVQVHQEIHYLLCNIEISLEIVVDLIMVTI